MLKRKDNIRLNKLFPLLVFVFLGVLCSCNTGKLTPLDYVKWVEKEKNGLKQTKDMGEYVITVQYQPLNYLAIQAVQDPRLKTTKLEEEKRRLGSLCYFKLKYGLKDRNVDIMKHQVQDERAYVERSNYFSFGLQNDIHLVFGKDTLKPVLFNFDHTYGLSPDAEFSMAFEAQNHLMTSDMTFIVNDLSLNTGKLQFIIEQQALKSIPELITY